MNQVEYEYNLFKTEQKKIIIKNYVTYTISNSNIQLTYKDTIYKLSLNIFIKLINQLKIYSPNSNYSEYINLVYSLVSRYNLYYDIFQYSIISDDIFKLIINLFNITIECNGNPFNNRIRFCSTCIELDNYFGGIDSFFTYVPTIDESFIYINNQLNFEIPNNKKLSFPENDLNIQNILKRFSQMIDDVADNIALTLLIMSLNEYKMIPKTNKKIIINNFKINDLFNSRELFFTFIQNNKGYKKIIPTHQKINIIKNYINKNNEFNKSYKIYSDIYVSYKKTKK